MHNCAKREYVTYGHPRLPSIPLGVLVCGAVDGQRLFCSADLNGRPADDKQRHYTPSCSRASIACPICVDRRLQGLSEESGDAHAIAAALKTYGMMLADNGSDLYITGETNTSWNDNNLNQLKNIPGSAFEVVQTGPVITGYC